LHQLAAFLLQLIKIHNLGDTTMAKPNLQSVLTIADPMLSDNFELLFGTVPSVNGSGNTQALLLQCKTVVKPGMTIEQVTYDLFGHTVEFAGRLTYSHTMAIEFVENWQGTITRTLENWMSVARDPITQHGALKAQYTSDAILNIYNQLGNVSLSYKIINMFPTEIPDLSFDGSASTALSVSATFSYDRYIVVQDNTGNGMSS
jgi:hypothetical protein